MCRDEDESSEALEVADLTPLSGRSVSWKMAGESGVLKLDQQGRGKLRAVFRNSPRSQKVRLSVNGNFLIMKAAELDRVVTPPDWCDEE